MTTRHVLVLGAGLAGAVAAETLRDEGFDGAITLLGDEAHLPYDRPPLSKDYLQGRCDRDSIVLHPQDWYRDHDVTLRLGSPAARLDLATHSVTTTAGDRVRFDKVLLATGSTPRRLPLPGADLPGVCYLRTVGDSEAIRAAFGRANRVAIIGAGWIGLETAAAARAAGLEVTLLEVAELPLVNVLGPEVAGLFADLHRGHGVDVRCSVSVSELVAGDRGVAGVRLGSGEVVPADLVLVGVGITPNVRLAIEAGLEVDNGVLVDEHLRTSHPDAYAAGDVANAWHPHLGRRLRVEHWANARRQGAVAASALLGRATTDTQPPYFFSDQYDLGMEYTGYAARGDYDEVVVRRHPDPGQLLVFWLDRGRVLAGMNVNVWDVADDIARLVRSGAPLRSEELRDPAVPLEDLVRRAEAGGSTAAEPAGSAAAP